MFADSSLVATFRSPDPADTLQLDWPPEKKLTSDDAEFVISYVTDANRMGSPFSMADVNLLINGGFEQPGCLTGLCRHMKGAFYSAVDMGKCVLVGYLAESYERFSRKYNLSSIPLSHFSRLAMNLIDVCPLQVARLASAKRTLTSVAVQAVGGNTTRGSR